MGHYSENRESDLPVQSPVTVERIAGDLAGLLSEIHRGKASIKHDFERVKNSEKVREVSETLQSAGVFGLAGMIPKLQEVIPELAPLYNAMLKAQEVDEKQTQVIVELVKRVEELEGRLNG